MNLFGVRCATLLDRDFQWNGLISLTFIRCDVNDLYWCCCFSSSLASSRNERGVTKKNDKVKWISLKFNYQSKFILLILLFIEILTLSKSSFLFCSMILTFTSKSKYNKKISSWENILKEPSADCGFYILVEKPHA